MMIEMKKYVTLFAFTLTLTIPVSAIAVEKQSNHLKPIEEFEHGGGCRKNSPRGKCCHAGSKPYHCH
jgi:hypothetical protein